MCAVTRPGDNLPLSSRCRPLIEAESVFFTRRETALFVMFGFCAADSCGRQSKVFLPDRVNKNTSIGGGLIKNEPKLGPLDFFAA